MNPIALITRFTGLGKAASTFGLIAAVIMALGVAKCAYDRSIIKNHDAKITNETLKTDAVAKENAAVERADDIQTINQAEKERTDAIRKATDSKPSAARNAINCERLRRAGKDTAGLPACN
jgi:hypothetical protein